MSQHIIVEEPPAPARAEQASSPAGLPATSTTHEVERTGASLSSSSSSDSDDDGSSSNSDEGEDEDDVRLVRTTAAPTTAPPATIGGPNAAGSAAGPAAGPAAKPPAAKKRKATSSAVWEHFDIDVNDKDYAHCKYCARGSPEGTVKRSGGSTSAMQKHLHGKHSGVMVSLGVAKDSKQGRMDGKVVIAPNFKRDSIFWMLMTYQVRFAFACDCLKI